MESFHQSLPKKKYLRSAEQSAFCHWLEFEQSRHCAAGLIVLALKVNRLSLKLQEGFWCLKAFATILKSFVLQGDESSDLLDDNLRTWDAIDLHDAFWIIRGELLRLRCNLHRPRGYHIRTACDLRQRQSGDQHHEWCCWCFEVSDPNWCLKGMRTNRYKSGKGWSSWIR